MEKKRPPAGASAEKSASSTAPSTEGGGAKRRKIRLPSELSTALEEAAEQIGKWKWDTTKQGKSNVAPSLCYFFRNHSAFFPQVLALHIGFHLDHGGRR